MIGFPAPSLRAKLQRLLRKTRAREKFALLRIHKTGSQSFRAAFQECFSKSHDARINFGVDVTLEKLVGKRFVSPHMTVDDWLSLKIEPDWVIGVTLREPRARLRSTYRYMRLKPDDHPTGVGRLLRDLDYMAFLTSQDPRLCGLKDNVMTKFIGGGSFGLQQKDRNQVSLSNDYNIELAAERATSRLMSGEVIPLVLERQTDSVNQACKKLGILEPPAVGWHNKNKSPRAVTIDSSEVRYLEDQCLEHDFKIYRTACFAINAKS